MSDFLGEYEVTLDGKGRFLLPAGLRKQLSEEKTNEFVINRGLEPCLILYPLKSWKAITADVRDLNEFDPKARQFRRYFINGATPVELDSAGRLLLPKTLMEYAGLEKDAVLATVLNKIEIWDKSKYKQLFETFSPDAFSRLADEVMNKKVES